jgi:hypothetical protein
VHSLYSSSPFIFTITIIGICWRWIILMWGLRRELRPVYYSRAANDFHHFAEAHRRSSLAMLASGMAIFVHRLIHTRKLAQVNSLVKIISKSLSN